MRSQVAIAGHPIHAMLVPLPIGLFAWTFAADVAHLLSGDILWAQISVRTGIAGVVVALLAAAFGAMDYARVVTKTHAAGTGILHGTLNVAVVALFAVAAYLDANAASLGGGTILVLHAVGVLLLVVSGWLGGELVYRDHVGVVPHDAEDEAAETERHGVRLGGLQRR